MLTDRPVDAYIEENILPQQHTRRLANGSIDYTFYDRRARSHRGSAFRAGLRSLAGAVRRLIAAVAGSRPAAKPQLTLIEDGRSDAATPRKFYSRAA